ncbi:hypothetical protein NP233_g11692 [Leucocoprinus birnbaumii]|uniref:F-box domain-containing protein n=1 Tax=Leucocoprinus birnbaumii TaxID=56174 RepID=A0AAD5VG24_9AGAR|nr:hypothetical protein NP233_g11692 [Leucocoprinus birnbaumii]
MTTSYPHMTCADALLHAFDTQTSLPHHEIILVQEKLRALEVKSDYDVKAWSREKITLLRRLNIIQSPVGKLPQEILSTIFALLCQHPNPTAYLLPDPSGQCLIDNLRWFDWNPFPVELGKVSSRWREVAWSTPKLWISAGFMHKDTGKRRNPLLVRLYLENSRELPLHLALSYGRRSLLGDSVPFYKSEIFDVSVDSIILDNLSRVKTLVLRYPSTTSRGSTPWQSWED